MSEHGPVFDLTLLFFSWSAHTILNRQSRNRLGTPRQRNQERLRPLPDWCRPCVQASPYRVLRTDRQQWPVVTRHCLRLSRGQPDGAGLAGRARGLRFANKTYTPELDPRAATKTPVAEQAPPAPASVDVVPDGGGASGAGAAAERHARADTDRAQTDDHDFLTTKPEGSSTDPKLIASAASAAPAPLWYGCHAAGCPGAGSQNQSRHCRRRGSGRFRARRSGSRQSAIDDYPGTDGLVGSGIRPRHRRERQWRSQCRSCRHADRDTE